MTRDPVTPSDRPAFPPPVDARTGAIVLVHGAWVGEWCWSPVMSLLAASGRPVHAVSLTGHGMRRHEAGPHITLADHVTDLVALVETLDLVDVTLVAHSYGGRVLSGSLPRLGRRVARAVFIDAHAPFPDVAATTAVAVGPDDAMVPFAADFDPDPTEFGGAASVAWFRRRLVDQSAATLREPFDVPLPDHLELTYVSATADRDSPFAVYADAARSDPRWRLVELAGSHWLMVSHPSEVAAIIVDPASATTPTPEPHR